MQSIVQQQIEPVDSAEENSTKKPSGTIQDTSIQQWNFHQHQGYRFHKKKQYSRAANSFKTSQDIAWRLIRESNVSLPQECWDMLFNAVHNLAASYNAIGNNVQATFVLTQLHQYLMQVANCELRERSQRLHALAILDNTLFSLTSQLAYENRVKEIHQIINDTEMVANKVVNKLLG